MKDGGQIYLVRGSGTSPSAAPVPPLTPTAVPEPGPPSAATPFGMASPLAMGGGSLQQMQQQMMQNPEMVRQMMNSPLVEAMMNDPDMLQNMVQSNPQLKQMMESNPEVGHLLSDPAVLRQSLETARNPQLMREMMRNTDRAMSNIEAHPEGFNMLRRLYTNVQQPLSQLGQPSSSDDGPDVEPTASPTTPNTTALPNPWAPAPPNEAAASPTGLFGPPRPGARNPLAFAQMFSGAPGVLPPNRPPAAAGLLGTPTAPAGGVGAAFGAAAAGGAPPPFQAALAQLQLQQQQAQMGQPAVAGPPAQLLQQLAQSNPAVQQMLRDPAFMQQVQRQVQARMGGAAAGTVPGTAAGAPPAPYDLGAMMQLLNQNGSLLGLGGGGVGAAAAAAAPAPAAPAAPAANPGQLYAGQLQTLTDMGFFDSDANLRALVSTGGNVQAAVERLLS